MTKGRVSQLEDQSTEIIHSEEQRDKNGKTRTDPQGSVGQYQKV